jgi:hypothetical protein
VEHVRFRSAGGSCSVAVGRAAQPGDQRGVRPRVRAAPTAQPLRCGLTVASHDG